jgi:hypothetical protein
MALLSINEYQFFKWSDGWMDEWMDGWMDGWWID